MREQHLYRLTIVSWPTDDGRPFVDQPESFWQEIGDDFVNPSENSRWPEWLPDISEWFDSPGFTPGRSDKHGHHFPNAGLVVPTAPRRRHWLSRAGAEHRARDLRYWGCEVLIEKSDPITWSEA